MLRPFAHPVACCWMLFCVVAESLKPIKLFSQQLPTFLLFRDRRSVAQQCWIRLYSSSNIVGATYAQYAWFTKIYGLHPSHDALQVPHCWELLHPFAHHCQHARNNSQHCSELLRPFARSLSLQTADLSPRSSPLRNVSRGGLSATERQKFHTDDSKSVRNPVRSANWSTEEFHCSSYCLRMTEKGQKAACKRDKSLTKQSICVEYSLL